jgi:hypothetical protein
MKKLRLTLDDLRIESFPTGDPLATRGTVEGHYGAEQTPFITCQHTCPAKFTCDGTC